MRQGRNSCRVAQVALLVLLFGFAVQLKAQELDVRAYTNLPVGVNILLLGYGRSVGNILVDPSLPVEDLDARLNLWFVKYTRTINFFGLSSTVAALLPFPSGHWEGVQTGVGRRQRDLAGVADARFTFSVNFLGAPSLEASQFRSYHQGTIVGASFQLIVPTGQYDGTKLINLGANRWGFRPEVGISRAIGRWHVEAAGTLWLFTDNDDSFGGATLSQGALYALQGHLVYNFRPGFWLAFDAGYANGGTTTVDGTLLNTLQNNSRTGVTLQIPFGRRQGLRIAFNRGLATRIGADFDSFVMGYQFMWGGGL